MKVISKKLLLSLAIGMTLVACLNSSAESQEEAPKPLDIGTQFVASGWMGDGELGPPYVTLSQGSKENPHSKPVCIKVTYMSPGAKDKWAGIYWQNKPNNWGDQPGENLTKFGYNALTFWARGDKGGEVLRFIAGGIDTPGKPYKDSFKVDTGLIALEQDWKQYTIDLEGQDLSSVIGGIAWASGFFDNPEGLIFYLDDIRYERIGVTK